MKGLRRSIEFFKGFLHEAEDPQAFYTFLAEDTTDEVRRYAQVPGSVVLDVGGASGYVGEAFLDAGARALTVEYDPAQANEHGRSLVLGIIGDGCALPIATGSIDITYTSTVLEHVVQWPSMLEEMERVTVPGGLLYVTFTNWLSPWGGHETSPWHYLGGDRAAKRFERRTGQPPKNHFGTSLFKLSISDVLEWCHNERGLEVLDVYPRYYPRWTKPIVHIPGVREVLTWNVVIVMRRTGPS